MKPLPRSATIIQVLLVLAGIAGWIVYNDLAYGDWTCAFKRCVTVQNIRP